MGLQGLQQEQNQLITTVILGTGVPVDTEPQTGVFIRGG